MSSSGDTERRVKVLRKRLMQITTLESLERPLTVEEDLQVERRHDFEAELQMQLDTMAQRGRAEQPVTSPSRFTAQNGNPLLLKEAVAEEEPQGDGALQDCPSEERPGTCEDDAMVSAPGRTAPVAAASARHPGSAETWNRVVLGTHDDKITAMDCLGNRVITASADCTLRLWDLSTGKRVRTFVGHGNRVTGVAFLSTSSVVSTSHDCSIRVWSRRSGRGTEVYAYCPLNCVAVHLEVVATGSMSGKLQLWEGSRAAGLCNWTHTQAHSQALTCVAFSRNGKCLASGSVAGEVKVWRLNSRQLTCCSVVQSPVFSRIWCLGFLSNKLVWGDTGPSLKLLDLNTAEASRLPHHPPGGHNCLTESLVVKYDSSGATLLASTVDVRRGAAQLNVWRMAGADGPPVYQHTLVEPREGRLLAVAVGPAGEVCVAHDGDMVVYTDAGRDGSVRRRQMPECTVALPDVTAASAAGEEEDNGEVKEAKEEEECAESLKAMTPTPGDAASAPIWPPAGAQKPKSWCETLSRCAVS